MVPEATKSSISLSTEYGNSNDALLAALLKEQGFGPTTANSLDEQLRLSVSPSFQFLFFHQLHCFQFITQYSTRHYHNAFLFTLHF